MSVLFAGSRTIDAAVALYCRLTGPVPHGFLDKLGKDFWTLNAAALEVQYDENPDAFLTQIVQYTFRDKAALSNAVLLKSLDFLIYQCTEGDIPETSPVYAQMTELAEHYASDGVRLSEEYADAPWGLCADLEDEAGEAV